MPADLDQLLRLYHRDQQHIAYRRLGDRELAANLNSRFDVVARAYDYTPPIPAGRARSAVDDRQRPGGGADSFVDFIERQVRPAVSARVKVKRARQTLRGHSYGGLFALHLLFTRLQAFQAYTVADPCDFPAGAARDLASLMATLPHMTVEYREFALGHGAMFRADTALCHGLFEARRHRGTRRSDARESGAQGIGNRFKRADTDNLEKEAGVTN